MTKYGGAIAAYGLAAGMDLPSSVAPFILRGALRSIRDVPIEQRRVAWTAWPGIWTGQNWLKLLTKSASPTSSAKVRRLLAGQVRSKIVVKLSKGYSDFTNQPASISPRLVW